MTQLQATRRAVRIQEEIFKRILARLRVAVKERQIANLIRQTGKELGSRQLAFPPIVSFGKNAYQIHHKPGPRKLRRGDLVMLDYGVKVGGWCSDLTRMVFFGLPPKRIVLLYNRLLAGQERAVKKVRAGVAAKLIARTAYRPFLRKPSERKWLKHAVGHGVGKKIHILPNLKRKSPDVLKAGQIITVEPGIYDRRWGGMRVEDMVLVKRKGGEVLTRRIPKKFLAIYQRWESSSPVANHR